MKAARLHECGKPLVREDIPVPDIQPDEILVNVKACGTCRSDAQLVDGYFRPPARRTRNARPSVRQIAAPRVCVIARVSHRPGGSFYQN